MRTIALATGLLAVTASAAWAVEPADETFLSRAGYGHDNWTRKRYADLGRRDYVLEQLDPSSIPDGVINRALQEAEFDALEMELPELVATFGAGKPRGGEVALRQVESEMVLRAISSHRQLETLLTEFWANHFNVDLSGAVSVYQVPYMRDTIRPHVLGKFEDLVLAVAKSPAMLKYLNNDMSFRDGYVLGGRERGLNENYARELMELHCFGMDDQGGVYTQADVTEMARALTGWTIRRDTNDGFRFRPDGHDTGAKTVIKLKLPAGGGVEEGEAAIRMVANHWRTRNFITQKLVNFFVPRGIDRADLLAKCREVWTHTGGNLKAVVRTILLRPEIMDASKVKVVRPLHLIAASARSVNAQLGEGPDRWTLLRKFVAGATHMGQPLLAVPPPTGWDDSPKSWANAALMLERFNAMNTWYGTGAQVPVGFQPRGSADRLVDVVEERVLGAGTLRAATKTAIRDLVAGSGLVDEEAYRLTLAHVLSSSAFNNR